MANELKHFGIPGMRWGIRRNRSKSSSGGSEDHKTASVLKKKALSDMSNDELKKLTTRLQLEKQYKDLTTSQPNAGKKLVGEILQGATKQIATKFVVDTFNSFDTSFVKLLKESLNKKG